MYTYTSLELTTHCIIHLHTICWIYNLSIYDLCDTFIRAYKRLKPSSTSLYPSKYCKV